MALTNTVKLAFSYLKYYKKQTFALLLGTVMSVVLMTGVGSLLYSGKTADIQRIRDVYGDAHYWFDMEDGEFDKLQEAIHSGKWMESEAFTVEKAGILTIKEEIQTPCQITVAHADSGYLEMFHRNLLKGSYPQNPGEIALSEHAIRNLGIGNTLGSAVVLGGDTYSLCGILSDQWDETAKDMKVFVSADTKLRTERPRLYVKFEENGDVLTQVMAFSKTYGLDIHKINRVSSLTAYVGGNASPSIIDVTKTALSLPEGKLAYFWGTLNQTHDLTGKLILAALGIFAAFVIFSLFQVSVRKRTAQYSTLQTFGMDEHSTFGMILSELYMVLLAGYPIGAALGSLGAKILYSRMGEIFVDQQIGMTQKGTHTVDARDVAAQIEVRPGSFHISTGTLIGCAIFLIFLMLLVSFLLICRMRKFTLTEMQTQNTHTRKQSRRIYSIKCSNMTGILSRKFLFERKGTFAGIIVSLSLGGVLFLGTTYVVQNARIHNALSFKADDGLASDIQVYEDSHSLSSVIPSDIVNTLEGIEGVSSANPIRYTLGEIPLEDGRFRWPKYYAETADEEGFEPDPLIMERYNGIITRQSDKDYRLKTNVYGYSDQMLAELTDYLLEGSFDAASMKKEDTVILKTLMDGQGNYDGLDVSPGDSIRLKVPKNASVPEEALRFEGEEDWYVDKEFTVAAIVSRSLGKNDNYIGDFTDTVGVIMTNQQMSDDFGIDGYDSIGITLTKGADHHKVSDEVRAVTQDIPNCLIKDYAQLIEKQELYLRQKMFFFYGIAAILLLISIFHILNSMQYLVAARKREFGILRAMGITDAGFRRILVKEGLCYGACSGLFMAILYGMVQKVLYYALQHVFLYLHANAGLPLLPLIGMVVLNLGICVGAMLLAGNEVLNGNIIDEIAQ